MCLIMFVYVFECVRVCAWVCSYMCLSVFMYVLECVRICDWVCSCMCLSVLVYVFQCVHVCASVCSYMWLSVIMYVLKYVRICVLVCYICFTFMKKNQQMHWSLHSVVIHKTCLNARYGTHEIHQCPTGKTSLQLQECKSTPWEWSQKATETCGCGQ